MKCDQPRMQPWPTPCHYTPLPTHCHAVRCKTEWCWLAGTWYAMYPARTATPSSAGCTSLPLRRANGTRKDESSSRGLLSLRAMASRSTWATDPLLCCPACCGGAIVASLGWKWLPTACHSNPILKIDTVALKTKFVCCSRLCSEPKCRYYHSPLLLYLLGLGTGSTMWFCMQQEMHVFWSKIGRQGNILGQLHSRSCSGTSQLHLGRGKKKHAVPIAALYCEPHQCWKGITYHACCSVHTTLPHRAFVGDATFLTLHLGIEHFHIHIFWKLNFLADNWQIYWCTDWSAILTLLDKIKRNV